MRYDRQQLVSRFGKNYAGLTSLGWLNYAKVSAKIVGARDWIGTRYYIGQVQQSGNTTLYSDQRKYLGWTAARDKRISIHFGRLEEKPQENKLAIELKTLWAG